MTRQPLYATTHLRWWSRPLMWLADRLYWLAFVGAKKERISEVDLMTGWTWDSSEQ